MATDGLELGNFCVCLTVKDIAASRRFYEALGFSQVGGDQSQNWLVLANRGTKIGLFQGMFEDNILTFNPGWTPKGEPLETFTDVREIQRQLEAAGFALLTRADESSDGPAHFMIADPDGNTILFDQHVPKPGKR
ncbi:MAG: VOC family protein [Planctomycetes bacterium]|nr:VOC family protein [Planctomycetota bacterium]